MLDGWDVQGGILVDAADVVVRRSRVVGDGSMAYGISTTAAGSVRIEDVTLTGEFREAAIGGNRWSAERVEITRVTCDGAHVGDGSRLRNSTVHDFATAPGQEVDALVLHGTGRDVVVEDNRVELGRGPGSAVLVAPERAGERCGWPRGDPGQPARWRHLHRAAGQPGGVDDRRADHRQPVPPRRRGGAVAGARRAVLEDNTYLDGGRLPDR